MNGRFSSISFPSNGQAIGSSPGRRGNRPSPVRLCSWSKTEPSFRLPTAMKRIVLLNRCFVMPLPGPRTSGTEQRMEVDGRRPSGRCPRDCPHQTACVVSRLFCPFATGGLAPFRFDRSWRFSFRLFVAAFQGPNTLVSKLVSAVNGRPGGARLLAGSLEIPVCSRVAEIVREKLTGVRVCRYTCESVLSERFVRSKESGCGLPNGVGVVLLHVAAAGSRRSRLDPNSAR